MLLYILCSSKTILIIVSKRRDAKDVLLPRHQLALNDQSAAVSARQRDSKKDKVAEHGKQKTRTHQGGRTWQAFGGGKNGHETFRQARIYNFRDKCVVFAHNLKFSNLTQ